MFSQNMFSTAKTACKSGLSYKISFFSLVSNYLRPSNNSRQLIFNINAVFWIVIISQSELSSPIAANFCPTIFGLRFSFLCYFLPYWYRSIR